MKFVEKNGREWPSKKMYEIYHKNLRKCLWDSLALECYADATGNEEIYDDEGFKVLESIRQNFKTMTSKELYNNYELVSSQFEKLFNRLGRELFSFDEHTCYIGEYTDKNKNLKE